jgi:hypothetical protein
MKRGCVSQDSDQSRSGRFGEDKNPSNMQGFEPRSEYNVTFWIWQYFRKKKSLRQINKTWLTTLRNINAFKCFNKASKGQSSSAVFLRCCDNISLQPRVDTAHNGTLITRVSSHFAQPYSRIILRHNKSSTCAYAVATTAPFLGRAIIKDFTVTVMWTTN